MKTHIFSAGGFTFELSVQRQAAGSVREVATTPPTGIVQDLLPHGSYEPMAVKVESKYSLAFRPRLKQE